MEVVLSRRISEIVRRGLQERFDFRLRSHDDVAIANDLGYSPFPMSILIHSIKAEYSVCIMPRRYSYSSMPLP